MMHKISQPVIKKDHIEKMSGDAKYIADIKIDDILHAKILRSTKAHARIVEIKIPKLEDGYYIVDYKDIPGENVLKVVTSEQPIFAEEEVNFIGEAILLVAGKDEARVQEIIHSIEVVYEEEKAIYTLEDATEFTSEYGYKKGEAEKAFEHAAKVIEETFDTGYQEQAYIEPQGVIGYLQDNKVTILGSMQCPYYVKAAVVQVMGYEENQVQIIQTTTGGGFGGKEDYPSMLGCQVAIATAKIKKPIRLILNRREDMAVTPKRHPAHLVYRAALDKENNIIGMDVEIKLDGGAYAGLSSVVLQRSLITATGVYLIPNIKIHGKVMTTNTVPNGAFRGFGAPQSLFAIETFMVHLANKIGLTPLEFKEKYLYKQGDITATSGKLQFPVKLPEMLHNIEDMSLYKRKKEQYTNQSGRYRKGIGMAFFLHGCGFTGSAERDLIKSVVKLVKHEDNTLEILSSNTDIGQGLKTTLCKVVAEVLEIPLSQVKFINPDTDRVPNSGPTVASRSLMIVGKLLERAAKRLRDNWILNKYQVIEEHYKQPYMIPWDSNTFSGDAYPTYSWGINVVEVEVDTMLATTNLLGVWGVYDVGTVIDQTIMKGQMEGGMLQGLGYASMEKMENLEGVIRQASITDYTIPTAKDTIPFETACIDNPYEDGPFGAKGAGELTILGTAPAYIEAVEQAVGIGINCIPLTPEKLLKLEKGGFQL
ncbi:MAG: aldehyde oxidase [Clostridiales bacterium]|jgi:CO/xanthine dehydrogenase Mo-binding subunit|nr:aldehyde oxidase [Clostridiales bacterium]